MKPPATMETARMRRRTPTMDDAEAIFTTSSRVLEKAGMPREGRRRRWFRHPTVGARPRDCWCYARLKEAS